jgi:gluconolactonase
VLDKVNGKRVNSPNDLTFTPDGALWFTDPPYGLVGQDKDPAKEQPFNAVWRYAGGKATAVITDLPRPNGIGFSADGKKLYISNSEPEMFINVYDVNADGSVSKAKRFITFPGPNPVDVPDGLKDKRLMSLDNPLVRLELVADLLDQMKFSNPADEG